jgi:hypothetical protein
MILIKARFEITNSCEDEEVNIVLRNDHRLPSHALIPEEDECTLMTVDNCLNMHNKIMNTPPLY